MSKKKSNVESKEIYSRCELKQPHQSQLTQHRYAEVNTVQFWHGQVSQPTYDNLEVDI